MHVWWLGKYVERMYLTYSGKCQTFARIERWVWWTMDPVPSLNNYWLMANLFVPTSCFLSSPRSTPWVISKQMTDVKKAILCFMLWKELSKRKDIMYYPHYDLCLGTWLNVERKAEEVLRGQQQPRAPGCKSSSLLRTPGKACHLQPASSEPCLTPGLTHYFLIIFESAWNVPLQKSSNRALFPIQRKETS